MGSYSLLISRRNHVVLFYYKNIITFSRDLYEKKKYIILITLLE